MAENDNQQKEPLWQRIKATLAFPDTPVGARTFALTLRILVILVVVYALAHAGSLMWAEHRHTEQSALDADRMTILLDTAQLEDQLLANHQNGPDDEGFVVTLRQWVGEGSQNN